MKKSEFHNTQIMEYDQVDPLSVLHLTMLTLEFPLTPEHAAHIRRTDPRPFPCFTVNAVENGMVLGQVGVFRLPMISTEGREDVGGVWAVSTHPEHAGRGIASRLLDEAHSRMREAGLRFSTLGTDRYRIAYKLYQNHGYTNMKIWATVLARWEEAHQPTRLRAQPPGPDGFDFVEDVFRANTGGYLGFAWRHSPFTHMADKMSIDDILVLYENDQPVGYALVNMKNSLLNISSLFLRSGIDTAEAVSAIAAARKNAYVQVAVTRPTDIARLQRAGYRVANPNWNAFMVKPLVPDVTVDDARRLFGIGTDRFLISWLDIT